MTRQHLRCRGTPTPDDEGSPPVAWGRDQGGMNESMARFERELWGLWRSAAAAPAPNANAFDRSHGGRAPGPAGLIRLCLCN